MFCRKTKKLTAAVFSSRQFFSSRDRRIFSDGQIDLHDTSAVKTRGRMDIAPELGAES